MTRNSIVIKLRRAWCSYVSQYASRFIAGDVVGMGINFTRREVFITKNGVYLGAPFKLDLDSQDVPLWACVAVANPGAQFKANFGTQPFRFNFKARTFSSC